MPVEALTHALRRLADGPLRASAERLFNALGYRSERTQGFDSVTGFVDWLGKGSAGPLTDRQRALFADWTAAEIVFQITREEIDIQAPPALLEGAAFDAGRHKSFLFVAADLRGAAWTRTQLGDMARAVNRGVRMPVVLLFRHGAAATLAAVRRRPRKRDPERDVLQNITLVKDINCREPHRAHLDILADLALDRLTTGENVRDFDDLHAAWEKTLDIETLNRRFYNDLFGWFRRAVRECRFPDDGAGKGNAERHVIRTITRLLFIWFLVEKNLVPRRLFTSGFAREALKRYDANSTDYYRAVLQNLFFATLNTEIGKRKFRAANGNHRVFERYRYRDLLADPDVFAARLRRVPFVNGGLFDCLDDFEPAGQGGRRVDAFTDHPGEGKALSVPARLFLDEAAGLFPLFRRYKFTVEENTPLDTEVALDPELLGRVFENLLAAYDPETETSERKATGSYYTPRYIVDYMVDEALVAALAEKAQPTAARHDAAPWRERLRRLFRWEDAFDDPASLFDENETGALVRAIARLRVLDPAVGSGAFPMGVLHKLTLALRRLDPGNERWEKIQKEIAVEKAGAAFEVSDPKARDSLLADISNFFEIYRRSDFGRKLYLIQNGIFGVDIQPVACQIAKLRFFISLAIEQTRNDDADDNYGFRPLPNLETRFVAANALIGLAHAGGVLRTPLLSKIERELAAVRECYFNARTRRTKAKARHEDVALRAEMAEELESADYGKDNARSIADWDPYNQNTSAEWFDPEWMFGISDGFDVTIGNPPYIKGDAIPDKAKLRAEYDGYYRGAADIYTYFFHRGVDLLCDNGVLCFITSNKFMRAGYGVELRKFLKQAAPPLLLLDIGRTGTFDATVRPSVVLAKKGNRSATMRAATVRSGLADFIFADYVRTEGFTMPLAALADGGWSLATPDRQRLRQKIEAAGVPLREYLSGEIRYGVKTGLNAAFVIDAGTRDRLVDDDAASSDLIRPWLRGRDVRRWRTDWRDLYVIFSGNKADIDRYPAIRRHLAAFRADLEPKKSRQDKRGRAPGPYKWFQFQVKLTDTGKFVDPKIVYPVIGREMRAVLDRNGYMTNDKCFVIPEDNPFLLSILNSKPFDFWCRLAMPCLDDPFDGGDMEFRGAVMQNAPIAQVDSEISARMATLANRVQAAKHVDPKADTTLLESEIDEIACAAYGLSADDIALIDRARSR